MWGIYGIIILINWFIFDATIKEITRLVSAGDYCLFPSAQPFACLLSYEMKTGSILSIIISNVQILVGTKEPFINYVNIIFTTFEIFYTPPLCKN